MFVTQNLQNTNKYNQDAQCDFSDCESDLSDLQEFFTEES